MKYISTRNKKTEVSAAQAIVQGISKEGGLFVPFEFPKFLKEDFDKIKNKSYREIANYVLSKFLTEFTKEEIEEFTRLAYSKFTEKQVPVIQLTDEIKILELWHGPTAAFKDVALTLLPYLLVASKEKTKQKDQTLVLVATSGDTGKAALEGFKDVDGTNVIVFYPSEGVSPMQKLQMMTQEGNNVYVCAIEGNFDDAQSAVKTIFQDKDIIKELEEKAIKLSSANSINWGRLLPQIVYYFSSYVNLIDTSKIDFGDKVNICVPTGNFGNILAAYYAFKMGLPINKLICASNSNNVLSDFFKTGIYDINREFYKTMSPSMDILISSNLERLLFECSNRDDLYITKIMQELKDNKRYEYKAEYMQNVKEIFYGNFATEEETSNAINDCYKKYKYLLDTHTAVAYCVYNKYKNETKDLTPTIIASTANPYKFPCDVLKAFAGENEKDALLALKRIKELTNLKIPKTLQNLDQKEIRFNKVINKKDIDKQVLGYVAKK